jgi:hypothetical protein
MSVPGFFRCAGLPRHPLRTRSWSGGGSWVEYQRITDRCPCPGCSQYAGLSGWNGTRGTGSGPMAHCWVLRQQDRACGVSRCVREVVSFGSRACPCSRAVLAGAGGAAGLLFENCIVDASILKQGNPLIA